MAFRKKRQDPFKAIQACLQKRDYKEAVNWFHTLLKRDPKNTQIRLRFADTLVLAGSRKEAVKQYRAVADQMADKGFMIRAIAINKKILKLDPNQQDVHEKLAAINEQRTGSASQASLASALSSPSVSYQEPAPAPTQEPVQSEPAPPPTEVSELSLEESMAMEFGEVPVVEPALDEAEVQPTPDLTPPPEPAPADAPNASSDSEEEVLVLDFEDIESDDAPAPPESTLDVPELEVEPEAPKQETHEPATGFASLAGDIAIEAEDPLAPSAPEPELDLSDAIEEASDSLQFDDVEEEAEPVGDVVESMTFADDDADVEIIPDDGADDDQGFVVDDEGFELEELELQLDSEEAADGEHALVGALEEDVDSLIDSIISDMDVPSTITPPAEEPAPTHIPLFSDLTMPEFVDVAILLLRRVAKAGEDIVRQGDPGDSMYIISTGEVKASVDKSGQQLPVATLSDGQFFGEMALLSGEPRSATITATKNTELLELNQENFHEICRRHPDIEAKIRLAYDERASTT